MFFMNQQTLESKLSDLQLGGIRYYETVDSTNDRAAQWAAKGAPDYSIVLADSQSNGRGRSGRKWFTYPESSLALSIIVRPTDQEQRDQSSLISRFSGLCALVVSQVLQQHYGLSAQIKWPNDVLVNNRKLCGILVEAFWNGDQLSRIVLGIGINVKAGAIPPYTDLMMASTSIESELGCAINRLNFLHQLLLEIIKWRSRLYEDVFLRAWESKLALRHELVRITAESQLEQDTDTLTEGYITGLGTDGSLLLQTPTGDKVAVYCGEVTQTKQEISEEPDFHVLQCRDVRLRPADTRS